MAQANPATEGQNAQPDSLHDLDVKALTTPMTAFEVGSGMYNVQHTTEHTVAEVNGEFVCDCRGFQFGHCCYHVRRLQFELGLREIPEWVNESAIDEMFREFLSPF